jgi:hypothetical protein
MVFQSGGYATDFQIFVLEKPVLEPYDGIILLAIHASRRSILFFEVKL